jgi:hypothetical protein
MGRIRAGQAVSDFGEVRAGALGGNLAAPARTRGTGRRSTQPRGKYRVRILVCAVGAYEVSLDLPWAGTIRGLGLTHNGEGGPIVRMSVFLADLLRGFGSSGGFVFAGLEPPIEGGHEFVSAGIVDVPKG